MCDTAEVDANFHQLHACTQHVQGMEVCQRLGSAVWLAYGRPHRGRRVDKLHLQLTHVDKRSVILTCSYTTAVLY